MRILIYEVRFRRNRTVLYGLLNQKMALTNLRRIGLKQIIKPKIG